MREFKTIMEDESMTFEQKMQEIERGSKKMEKENNKLYDILCKKVRLNSKGRFLSK